MLKYRRKSKNIYARPYKKLRQYILNTDEKNTIIANIPSHTLWCEMGLFFLVFLCEQECVMCFVVYNEHLFCNYLISQQYVLFLIWRLFLSVNNLLSPSALMVGWHQLEHLQVVTFRKESCIVYTVEYHQLLCRRYSFTESICHICSILKSHFLPPTKLSTHS